MRPLPDGTRNQCRLRACGRAEPLIRMDPVVIPFGIMLVLAVTAAWLDRKSR